MARAEKDNFISYNLPAHKNQQQPNVFPVGNGPEAFPPLTVVCKEVKTNHKTAPSTFAGFIAPVMCGDGWYDKDGDDGNE